MTTALEVASVVLPTHVERREEEHCKIRRKSCNKQSRAKDLFGVLTLQLHSNKFGDEFDTDSL